MTVSLGVIWLSALFLAGLVFKRARSTGLKAAGRDALGTFTPLIIRLPCALLAAAFVMQIVPVDLVSTALGPGSGVLGILIAAGVGGFLAGGPIVAFSIAVVLQDAGAGVPQLVALIAAWSVFDVNRLMTYELPIMGGRFASLRTLSCLALPLVAGFGAHLLTALIAAS